MVYTVQAGTLSLEAPPIGVGSPEPAVFDTWEGKIGTVRGAFPWTWVIIGGGVAAAIGIGVAISRRRR